MREHELDLALDCGLLGHLGVVDEGAALVTAGRDITGGHILQTFLQEDLLIVLVIIFICQGRPLTDDGCFPASVLSEDESQGRRELNVLSVIRPGAEGTDPLDLHLADLRHISARKFSLSLSYLNLKVKTCSRLMAP